MKVLKICLCRPLIEDDDEKEDELNMMKVMLVPEFGICELLIHFVM